MTRDEDYENLVRFEATELSASRTNVDNINTTERALCGQLMLVSTVFLSICVVALSGEEIIESLNYASRILIFVTFVLILASIACGVRYYFMLMGHFDRWGKLHHDNYVEFRDAIIMRTVPDLKKVNSNFEQMIGPGDNTWLKRQIFLLGVSAFGCMLTLMSLLGV